MPFFDGSRGRVFYRCWRAPDERAALVFLHGLNQHSGDYHRFAGVLNARGISTWALDHSGHGLSEGKLADVAGDMTTAVRGLATDAGLLADIVSEEGLPTSIAGHSLGAATAVTLLRLATHPFRSAALVAVPPRAAVPEIASALDAGRVPILVLHGVDDRMAPIDPVRTWVTNIRAARLIEYDDTGHDVLHEKVHRAATDAVADHVLEGPAY